MEIVVVNRKYSAYHIGTKSGRGHCGEIRRSGVVFATTNDCYTSKLACLIFCVSYLSIMVSLQGNLTFVELFKHGWHHLVHSPQNLLAGQVGGHDDDGSLFGRLFEKYRMVFSARKNRKSMLSLIQCRMHV